MSTNTLKNRVLSVLLVLVMVVPMLPIQVLGADGGAATVITSGGEVAFNVYKDAVAYANQHDGSTIKLQSDIDALTYEDPADMPFITGNVTLDLNGKSINFVDVGSVSFDEEGEIVKDKAGTLTVTAMLRLRGWRPYQLQCVTDAFSTKFETTQTMQNILSERIV